MKRFILALVLITFISFSPGVITVSGNGSNNNPEIQKPHPPPKPKPPKKAPKPKAPKKVKAPKHPREPRPPRSPKPPPRHPW